MRHIIYHNETKEVMAAVNTPGFVVEYPGYTTRRATSLSDELWEDIEKDPHSYMVEEPFNLKKHENFSYTDTNQESTN